MDTPRLLPACFDELDDDLRAEAAEQIAEGYQRLLSAIFESLHITGGETGKGSSRYLTIGYNAVALGALLGYGPTPGASQRDILRAFGGNARRVLNALNRQRILARCVTDGRRLPTGYTACAAPAEPRPARAAAPVGYVTTARAAELLGIQLHNAARTLRKAGVLSYCTPGAGLYWQEQEVLALAETTTAAAPLQEGYVRLCDAADRLGVSPKTLKTLLTTHNMKTIPYTYQNRRGLSVSELDVWKLQRDLARAASPTLPGFAGVVANKKGGKQ